MGDLGVYQYTVVKANQMHSIERGGDWFVKA